MTLAHLELVVHLNKPVYEDSAHVLIDVSLHQVSAVSVCQVRPVYNLLIKCALAQPIAKH